MIVSLVTVFAGIGWEPEIRGALVVLVGSAVLMGSVWLLLTTNIGSRVGTLNALAGFFGWMLIMGMVWWIYGGNVLRGDDPAWVPRELNFDLAQSTVGDVRDLADAVVPDVPALVDAYCPGLVEATEAAQRARVVQEDPAITLDYDPPASYCTEALGETLAVDAETIAENLALANEALGPDDPRFRDDVTLAVAIETAIDDQRRKVAQATLTTLASAAPDLIEAAEEAGDIDIGDWSIVSSADAGEAQARAGAFLLEEADASPYETAADFFVLDTYVIGGKPERSGDSVWDRVSNEIRNTVLFWHPTKYTVVQVVATLDKEPIPGEAPPFAEIDPDAQVVSVVMVRDLGSRRLPAALITLGSLAILVGLAWMMHTRDVELRRRVAEWDPNAAT